MNKTLRMTPQTITVVKIIKSQGHASNAQILKLTKKSFPNISATTIHRITTRLIKAKMASAGPKINGVKLIDSNLKKHDHFVCANCGKVKDVRISRCTRVELQQQTGSVLMPSSLIIMGDCQNCL